MLNAGMRKLTVIMAASLVTQLAVGANDSSNYEGDRVTFPRQITVQIVSYDDSLGAEICLEAGTKLWGLGEYNKNSVTGVLFRTSKTPSTSCDKSKTPIPGNSVLLVRTTNGSFTATADRSGLTYGALAVPFKFHVTGSKDFTGSASVGPYLGYRFDPEGTLGFGMSIVGFLGASNIAVAQKVNGSSSTQNLAGFSWGFGLIGNVKGNFQLGGVVGFDRVSANAGYEYNGKPWVALELGYSFLQ